MPIVLALIALGTAFAVAGRRHSHPAIPDINPYPPHPPGSATAWFAGYWQWSTANGWTLIDSRSGTGAPQSHSAAGTWAVAFSQHAPPYRYAAVFSVVNGQWQPRAEAVNKRADGSNWYVSAG